MKWLKSLFYRLLAPGYSWCHRCKMPWKFVKSHSTMFTDGRGMFPLCEKCWGSLTPAERVPYYRQLYNEWLGWGEEMDIWPQIEKAVLEGK